MHVPHACMLHILAALFHVGIAVSAESSVAPVADDVLGMALPWTAPDTVAAADASYALGVRQWRSLERLGLDADNYILGLRDGHSREVDGSRSHKGIEHLPLLHQQRQEYFDSEGAAWLAQHDLTVDVTTEMIKYLEFEELRPGLWFRPFAKIDNMSSNVNSGNEAIDEYAKQAYPVLVHFDMRNAAGMKFASSNWLSRPELVQADSTSVLATAVRMSSGGSSGIVAVMGSDDRVSSGIYPHVEPGEHFFYVYHSEPSVRSNR